MAKFSCIYEIVNTVNDKRYVGSALDFEKRKREHLHHLRHEKHHSRHLMSAWKKYGEGNFEFRVLEIVNEPANLVRREQMWIDALDTSKRSSGYNISPTAGSPLGVKHSAETRAKLAGRVRRERTPEEKARYAAKMASPETREKLSAAAKKRMADPILRAMYVSTMLEARAKAYSPEALAKTAAKSRGRKLSEEARERRRGKKMSAECLAKRSLALKGRVMSPESRAKMSAAKMGNKNRLGGNAYLAKLTEVA